MVNLGADGKCEKIDAAADDVFHRVRDAAQPTP